MEWTVKCPVCDKPYVVHDGYAFDQSACPRCRTEARGESFRDRIHAG